MTAVAGHGHAPISSAGSGAPAQRNTMAAVIVVVTIAVGMWSAMGYLGSMASVLAEIDATNDDIAAQMQQAQVGLRDLDRKTANVRSMTASAQELSTLMSGINGDMGGMIDGVDSIGTGMGSLGTSLSNLVTEVGTVATTNTAIAGKLAGIDRDLTAQASQVRAMRRDVAATSGELRKMPNLVRTTNDRLHHVNSVVCYMGTAGQQSHMKLYITFLGIPNGNAEIDATMIPPGGWRC